MGAGGQETTKCWTQRAHLERERAIMRLALSQHGIVGLDQLRGLGLSASAVRSRVATQRLRRLHRGVYSVDCSALSAKARYMAALLACGPGGALSHQSAAALLDLRACGRKTVDISVPSRAGRARDGIAVHRAAGLARADLTEVSGIRCTSVARTLLDLAEVVDRRALERALDEADVLRVYDQRSLDDVLMRAGGRHGRTILQAVLAEHAIGTTLTREELEARFLALCDDARLPRPRVNHFVALEQADYVIDFAWPAQRLAVETDGRRFHGGRLAFERDRRRDQRLTVAGWRPLRFTWRQVVQRPADVAATLRALLSSRLGS